MDVYDQLCEVDVIDSESLQPRQEIKFKKVTLSTYGENKNDAFFESTSSEAASDSSADSTDSE